MELGELGPNTEIRLFTKDEIEQMARKEARRQAGEDALAELKKTLDTGKAMISKPTSLQWLLTNQWFPVNVERLTDILRRAGMLERKEP